MILNKTKSRLAKKVLRMVSEWSALGDSETRQFGNNVRVSPNVLVDKSVTIGPNTYINGPDTQVFSGTIGAFCSIAWGVTIGPDEHPIRAVSTHPFWYDETEWCPTEAQWKQQKPVPFIGNDVWIGCNATITRGAIIHDGAVIGAGSIVLGEVPAYAVVVGCPAQVIKYRFPEAVRNAIRQSKWWEWDEATLLSRLNWFQDPYEFLNRVNSQVASSRASD
ncbi:CatB-related O-acetyltransferase [Alicyclobacillus fastidiosus]|uniref:CatB-related O-acetyltransferase n=1 Tax=Alicyclobacillus fastidiosus TaxID=392011 RepID=UPI0023E967B8|nr:CatB-related O-acetyltransferase [Alicyclobacillus fastidiosus]GMA61161.1 hypothetical protein GCM10025859_16010 [Alicyclobacillus fastidiosus]